MNSLLVIKHLLSTSNYHRYRRLVYDNIGLIKANNKYLVKLLLTIQELKEKYPKDVHSEEELRVLFDVLYPALSKDEKEYYEVVFEKLSAVAIQEGLVYETVQQFLSQVAAGSLAIKAISVSEGKGNYADLIELMDSFEEGLVRDEEDGVFASSDLGDIHANLITKAGFRWRLNTLNKSLGSLRKGNFGFIVARPETGKTSFLASEVSFMATQTDGLILWVNNEEENNAVYLRNYSAVLGLTQREIFNSLEKSKADYLASTGDRIKIYGRPFATKKDIESVCKEHNPCLIIFDQLAKVRGFEADRHDLVLKQQAQWARELAKVYGPVIGVSQAGASAEGKQYLDMNDIDGSHTGLAGEADWIVGIGRRDQEGYEEIRYLHAMKNKLPGDTDTEPMLRHIKAPVRLKPEIARYIDVEKL